MTIIYFKYYNAQGEVQECSYGGPSLESGLDMLTELINHGWKLVNIRILGANNTSLTLPIEAFDGVYFGEPLVSLQQEWEEILLPVA